MKDCKECQELEFIWDVIGILFYIMIISGVICNIYVWINGGYY